MRQSIVKNFKLFPFENAYYKIS